MAHADFGSTGDEAVNKATSAFLSQVLQKLMAPDGVIVSDQVLELDGWTTQPLPEGIPEDRYFILRA